MEPLIVSLLPESLRPATKNTYANTATVLYRMLYNKDAGPRNTPVFLSQSSNYKRIPDLVRKSPNLKSPHSRYNLVNMASVLCRHLGYTKATEYLRLATEEFKPQRDKLMTQEGHAPTLEANYVPYDVLLKRVTQELLPPFWALRGPVTTNEERWIVMSALLGVMNVIEPNMRGVLADCQIVPEGASAVAVSKSVMIFMPDRVDVVVLEDKVSGRSGPDRWALGKSAEAVVRRSLEVYPRSYLFTSSLRDDTPMNRCTYLRELGTALMVGDRVPSNNVLRHVILDHFYKTYPSPTVEQKMWLARRMRHHHHTGEEQYRKPKI